MTRFTCTCTWMFIIGKRRVYGPIWLLGLPGHPRCHNTGRMMSRKRFTEEYSDCAYRFEQGLGTIER